MARRRKWRKLWKKEEIMALKTSDEVASALVENPLRLENETCLYKKELAFKERKEKYGYENPLVYLFEVKREKK